jgi:hypothetical protein
MNATAANFPTIVPGNRMRIVDVLLVPRYANSRVTRWTAAVLFCLHAATALAIGIFVHDPHAQAAALIVYGFGVGFLWLMWLSALLLIARDGRRLRLAGVVRNTATATVFYAVACVAAPVAITAYAGGDVALAALYPALAIAAFLAFVLFPRYLATWFGFLPAIYIGLHNVGWAPSPFQPSFQHGAWVALAIFAVGDVIRWRQLLHSEDNDASGWRSAILMQFRRNLISRDWGFDRQWDFRRSANRVTAVDLRGIGPAAPVKGIRVVLGGWFLPQTLRSRLGNFARVLLPLLLLIPLFWVMRIGHAHSILKAWQVVSAGVGLWLGVFGALMLALAVVGIVHRRWRQHANLGLLALTPGLGGSGAVARVSRALFTGPAIGFAVLWLCLLVPTLTLFPNPMAALLGSLFVIAMAALMVLVVLGTLAGRPLGVFAKIVLGLVLMVLADASFIFVTVADGDHSSGVMRAQWLAALAWSLLIAWATWQAVKARRALQQQPHPFLANSP